MGRTTITVTDEAYTALDAERRDGESWSELFHRLAADTEHGPNTVAAANVDEIARAVGDEVENRLTRR